MFHSYGISASIARAPADSSRYYYGCLTNEQKAIYNALFSGVKKFAKEIKLPMRPINELKKIFHFMLLDNPILFYVFSFYISNDMYKKKCVLKLEYQYTRQEVQKYTDAVVDYVRVFNPVMGKSDIEKEIYVHDYCLNNFGYNDTFFEDSHSVLGPVRNRTAVCEGIAGFVKLAFDYLGIESLVVEGKAKNPMIDSKMEKHVWNIVRIAGKPYHLDVTFDMTLSGRINRYDYFNLSDEEIKKDHITISGVPKCATTGNDYYSQNALAVSGSSGLAALIDRSLRQGKMKIVVRLISSLQAEELAHKVMQVAQRQYVNIYRRSTMVELSYNADQLVFEIHFK